MNGKFRKSRSLYRSTPSVKNLAGAESAEVKVGSSRPGGLASNKTNAELTQIKMNSTRELSEFGSKANSLESVANVYERSMDEDQGNLLDRDKLLAEEMNEIWRIASPLDDSRLTERVLMLKQLMQLNAISKATIRKYRIRVLDDAIVFPRFTTSEFSDGQPAKITGIKICRLPDLSGTLDDVQEEIFPNANIFNGLFGYNLIQPNDKELIVVGRESDSMAIYQATKNSVPALVLSDINSPLSYDAIPYLQSFNKITFWFPTVFYNRIKLFARRLSVQRCLVVSPKMTNFAPADLLGEGSLSAGYERIIKILGLAEILITRDVETFATLKDSAKDYVFGTGQVNGLAQWKRFPILNHYMKGFRLGEVTIVSGPTGCGKTTFLSEYSLDLCEQNVNTLWCSLEIPNSRLVSIMVCQYARKEFMITGNTEFDFWYDKLMHLPMYFAKFDMSTPVKRIVESIEHQISAHEIQHVIIDNVQVINDGSDQKTSLLESKQQQQTADEICSMLRKIATQKNVHVTVVVHPNRESDDINNITIGSLYGAVKATQSADNILIIQRKYYRLREMYYEKFLQIWKNRYAGEVLLGERLQMFFDSRSKCHRLILRSKKTSSKE